jgi:hypothetical protein
VNMDAELQFSLHLQFAMETSHMLWNINEM